MTAACPEAWKTFESRRDISDAAGHKSNIRSRLGVMNYTQKRWTYIEKKIAKSTWQFGINEIQILGKQVCHDAVVCSREESQRCLHKSPQRVLVQICSRSPHCYEKDA